MSRPTGRSAAPESDDQPLVRTHRAEVEVNGKRFDVSMWVPDAAAKRRSRRRRTASKASGRRIGLGCERRNGQIAVPMQGTIVKVERVEGRPASRPATSVVVLEAMKMENNITADVSGTVTEVKVSTGDSVGGGDVVVVIDPS